VGQVTQVWFSAMLRFVILVENEGATDLSRSVLVFRAEDFAEAKQRALDLGRSMETTYRGGTGQEVRWRLETIETLDLLGDTITDGREIYSEPTKAPAGMAIPFDAKFDPANSTPGQSGV